MTRALPVPIACRLALPVLIACLLALPAGARAESVRCDGAVAYRGPALRPPPVAADFPDSGASIAGPLEPALAARLDSTLVWIGRQSGVPGVAAAVAVPGRGLWSAARGLALADPATALAGEPYFYWASAGKAFTAAVVLRLVEEGRLSYEDPLARWFPDLPQARAITVDHLLTHTHGIFSFQADLRFRERTGYSPPEELLRVARRHGLVHCPGEHWSYSNTGYVLLARIVEEVEGRPFHEVVTARILRPLGLTRTVALAPRQVPAGVAVGHREGRPDRDFDMSTPFGAGAIVASAADMVRFWEALLTGRLVARATVREAFARLHPMFGQEGMAYGRGVMSYEVPDGARRMRWLGHSGGTPSYKAVVAYDTETRAFVAVAINAAAPAEAAALRLVREVRTALASD